MAETEVKTKNSRKARAKKVDADPRNVMVKSLRAHSNQHGEKFKKAANSTYRHPAPVADIAVGNVELVETAAD